MTSLQQPECFRSILFQKIQKKITRYTCKICQLIKKSQVKKSFLPHAHFEPSQILDLACTFFSECSE